MSASVRMLVIIFLSMVAYQAICEASLVNEMETPQQYRLKRSLCNTFGGCGAKRSLQQQATLMVPKASDGFGGIVNDRESLSLSQNKREASANLVAEVLNDLIEFLQTNDKYKHGKYVLMVPKAFTDNSMNPIGASANNNIIRASNNAEDLQELRVGRLFQLDKNE